ncbi:hypothetical protein F511_36802 [Dorcoceras hygrometricum]|uniref:Uncharacterized protein n=1 Tax=Dorcoceras hygrometricum TaxID=472368 RepID=A0A2Z7BGJ5_9LAMI|nr:hypothetical protein F511_36802 [Dorcoceras hygrometricum]
MDKFEIVLPHPDERAHRPPPGFHTFYMNQLDMGLRFPIPSRPPELSQHPPGPLRPHAASQIKRFGLGKFYIYHKGDHTFIKGNPSSHKGWMSRFLYIKRTGNKRNPWRCEMSYRDNLYTLTPSTPERSPNLISFLDAMRDKSYNAPELIKEDLLCFFGFSRKGVGFVGDLDRRMGKAEILMAWDEAEEGSSGAAVPSKKVAKKRKASTPADKEARRQKKKGTSTSGARPVPITEERRVTTPPIPKTEERPDPTPVITGLFPE